MKVGIFSDVAESRSGGPDNIMYNLVDQLCSLDHGHDIVLLHTSQGDSDIYDGRDDMQIPENPARSALKLRSEGFDVVHFDSVAKQESLVYPFLLDAALVATQYGDVHFADADIRPQSRRQILEKRWAQRVASRFLDTVMPISESAKQNLSKGIPADKMEVVYPGLDRIFEDVEVLPREERSPFLFNVSNLNARKNPAALLGAYERLVADGYDHDLKIAGKNWNEDVLAAHMDDAAAMDRVELLGKIPVDEVKEYYKRCMVYLAPTRHEGFGLTPLEAMACGTPVVSNGVYAVPEVVGDAGLLVDDPDDVDGFTDAVERLLDDKELWATLSEKGQERAQEFTWEESARTVVNIYERVA
ncbi:MAG: glycosyltransferase family 4 protein [Candidatus Nanohaloarchaea archaeon]|nr:glycosyltransferase family 4 protein [Candidatus Nanohaloarchaea archaeon]